VSIFIEFHNLKLFKTIFLFKENDNSVKNTTTTDNFITETTDPYRTKGNCSVGFVGKECEIGKD